MQYAVTCKTNKAEGYVGIAEECFTMDTHEWRAACLEPTDRGAKRSEFNSYLAEVLHESFDPDSDHVQGLRQCLCNRGARAMRDGRLILDLIAGFVHFYKRYYMDAVSISEDSTESQLLAVHTPPLHTPPLQVCPPPPQPTPWLVHPQPPKPAPLQPPPLQPSPPKTPALLRLVWVRGLPLCG